MNAAADYDKCVLGQSTDNMHELTYQDQKAIHNLKYYIWVEQQAKEVGDLNTLWYDHDIWNKLFDQVKVWNLLIEEFNERTAF